MHLICAEVPRCLTMGECAGKLAEKLACDFAWGKCPSPLAGLTDNGCEQAQPCKGARLYAPEARCPSDVDCNAARQAALIPPCACCGQPQEAGLLPRNALTVDSYHQPLLPEMSTPIRPVGRDGNGLRGMSLAFVLFLDEVPPEISACFP